MIQSGLKSRIASNVDERRRENPNLVPRRVFATILLGPFDTVYILVHERMRKPLLLASVMPESSENNRCYTCRVLSSESLRQSPTDNEGTRRISNGATITTGLRLTTATYEL